MKLVGEVEIEKDNNEDIKLLVNIFEKLKEINAKVDELVIILQFAGQEGGDSRV